MPNKKDRNERMRKINRLLLFLIFTTSFLSSCGLNAASSPAEPLNTSLRAHNEKTLLDIMQDACGSTMEAYCYVDMDNDGKEELIGTYLNQEFLYSTWYCSSDGETCLEVHTNSTCYEGGCSICPIPLGNETHVAINAYNWFGDAKNFAILSLHDSEIETIVSDVWGNIYTNEAGDILLGIEAYDAFYDAEYDFFIWHSWKDTYLYYDGYTYKQFGATPITEEEFLQFENAAEILASIRGGNTYYNMDDKVKLELSYWIRKNGILHIQCAQYDSDGDIYFSYYTMRYQDNVITVDYEDCREGQMAESLSTIEATY